MMSIKITCLRIYHDYNAIIVNLNTKKSSQTGKEIENSQVAQVDQSAAGIKRGRDPNFVAIVGVSSPVGEVVLIVATTPRMRPVNAFSLQRRRKERRHRTFQKVWLSADSVVRVAVVAARTVETQISG